MNFELDDDERDLQANAREVVARECPSTVVRAVLAGGDDDQQLWKTLVDLGWPSLTVPAADGGLGASTVALGVVLEQLGAAADPTPFLGTTSQYVAVVRECASDEQRAALLGAVCDGGTGAVAFDGPGVVARRDGDSWVVSGSASYVLDGDRADAIAVVTHIHDEAVVFIVRSEDVSASRRPTFDGAVHVADVTLDGVRVRGARVLRGPAVEPGVARARSEAIIGLAAATVGACQHVLDMAVEHVKERRQFGVPIGSFQAIKHMAVDVHIAIERARALWQHAARVHAAGGDDLEVAASMAKAGAGDAQRIAVQHGIQLFGGLGYTWENDVHLFARRALLGELLLGSSTQHRALVARAAMREAAGGERPVRVRFDEGTEAFRAEFEAWLDEHAPDPTSTFPRPRSSADLPSWARAWQRTMFDAGWLAPANPPELGGRNASMLEQFAHLEVLGERRMYISYNPQGLGIIVPSILTFGTEEQKRRWAVPIMRGEITAALGMSEPDAGSDLAGLRTRAVLDDGRFIINGQKVWTSGAHDADVILAFVRTDPDAPKHRGISAVLVPTDVAGLTRRPFGSVVSPDDLDFNEVFFDDVEVPAENLVGELNGGWRVANESLGHERAMLWLNNAERLDDLVIHGAAALTEHGSADDAVALDWYGTLMLDAYAIRLLGYRALAKLRRGEESTEQSLLKLFGSEAIQVGARHVFETLGPAALDPDHRSAPLDSLNYDGLTASWFERYLRSFSGTIAGGTSQIQRNIIGERVLGLPR